MINEQPQDYIKPHVLLVDDMHSNLVAMKTTLKGLDCHVHYARSGNVSAYQLINQDFPKLVRALMSEFQLKPDFIELELTETAVMDDMALIRDALFELNDIGFTLSIDDFGTGYSMLSYLKKLPISNIKIDAEFIRDVTDNESSAMIVRAIIALAKNFKLSVIAEGVETKEQAAFLVDNECLIAQGFLYSKALSPAEIVHFIKGL